jgi:hypothetical protein
MRTRIIWLTAVLLWGFMGLNPGHAQENILTNGGFEDGVPDPFTQYGGATIEVVQTLDGAAVSEKPIEGDYALHIVVPSAGATSWDVGLQHDASVFEAGKHYTLSAFLKSKEGDLEIRFKPERGEDPWESYGGQVFTMNEEWQEFSVTTPVFTEDITPASLTWHISFTAGDFWIDAVRWYEGDYVPPVFKSFQAQNPDPEDGALHADTWASNA